MKNFRDLEVWLKAHSVTVSVYELTASFPRTELFGLSAQLRRSSSSMAANIAEACGRSGDGDFARFLGVAMGSASETEYELLLAHELGYTTSARYELLAARVTEVKRMLATLIRKVNADRTADS